VATPFAPDDRKPELASSPKSNRNPLNLVQRDLVAGAIMATGRAADC